MPKTKGKCVACQTDKEDEILAQRSLPDSWEDFADTCLATAGASSANVGLADSGVTVISSIDIALQTDVSFLALGEVVTGFAPYSSELGTLLRKDVSCSYPSKLLPCFVHG